MLCCHDLPLSRTKYSPVTTNKQQQRWLGDRISHFPGQRRELHTGTGDPQNLLTVTPGNALVQDTSKERLTVIVPEGMKSGQTLQVADGNGRMVSAVIPDGLSEGQSFVVDFPRLDPPDAKISSEKPPSERVLVTVPEGKSSGDVIHVASPDGSGRTVAATIPPGMHVGSTFVVEFPPMPPSPTVASIPAKKVDGGGVDVPVAQPVDDLLLTEEKPQSSDQIQQEQQQQQLILVKVPPGVRAGTTLHVQVPGEEGRIIAAEVPAGDVKEFRVAVPPSQPQQQQQGGNNGVGDSSVAYMAPVGAGPFLC